MNKPGVSERQMVGVYSEIYMHKDCNDDVHLIPYRPYQPGLSLRSRRNRGGGWEWEKIREKGGTEKEPQAPRCAEHMRSSKSRQSPKTGYF